MPVEATALVNYQSKGRVVIIGNEQAAEIAPRLSEKLHAMVVLTEGEESPGVTQVPLGGREIAVEGFLGDYKIRITGGGDQNSETIASDIVLDLSPEPLINSQISPPGYIHSSLEEDALQQAIDELSGLTGSFEKPRFFSYNPEICAHGYAGKTACNRCVEACPADAIISIGEKIEVNPNLCQGGGTCTTVCPSGAIRYAYPTPRDNLDRLRKLLSVYREQGGSDPILVFIAEADSAVAESLDGNQLPFLLEELASVGLETWLSVLAFGARTLQLIAGKDLPQSSDIALRQQLRTADELLMAMGYEKGLVSIKMVDEVLDQSKVSMPDINPAGFSGMGGKRQTAYLAIDHLHAQAESPASSVNLSEGAPFGMAEVDGNACTLCFSCVSACPGKALLTAGEGVPQLQFIEENCLQCGMCTQICPEDAISISPRLLFDPAPRKARRKLHEEAPYLCTSCGKPFATRSVIDNMLEKLKGHYMFQDERARRRLTMCEDCRVIDIVQDPDAINGDLDQGFRQ
jgi:ferredoxin